MKRASACLSLSVWRRLWQTRAVDKSGTPPCAPFPPNFNVALVDKRGDLCVTQRLLKSWRGLRSFARVTVCNIEDGGGKGGEGLVFVAEFLAVGKRSAFRSLPGAALRSALGCKNVAAAGGASACKASSGGKPKEERVGFCTLRAAGACETPVSGFCRSGRIFAALVCLGECEVFASELALAEAGADPKSGPRGGPKFGAALPSGN